MAYSPATIANYFLDKASREVRAITPMQLIKLVYIAHGWHLGYTGTPLIDEEVQAWKYGPVIKSLYDRVRHYGRGAVTAPVRDSIFGGAASPNVDENTAGLLDSVWKNYAGFSGVQLSSMTHQKGTPWWQAWHDEGGNAMYFAPISDDVIRSHYSDKIAQMRAKSSAS